MGQVTFIRNLVPDKWLENKFGELWCNKIDKLKKLKAAVWKLVSNYWTKKCIK